MKSHRRLGKSAEQKVILVFTLCTVIGVAIVGVVMWYSFERWQLTHALIHLECGGTGKVAEETPER